MSQFDLIVKGGRVATAADVMHCDIGIKDGRVVSLAESLDGADRVIDASGSTVTPGGVDGHCHLDQPSMDGTVCADDFTSGTRSAAAGGTTTVIPFALQMRGHSLQEAVEDYHRRSDGKALIDYAFHLIVTDATAQVCGQELPALLQAGYSSFKIYMTYDAMKVTDYQILDILALARRDGALVMVHAENHDMIQWLAHHLVDQGHVAPKFHAIAHARVAEAEATNRAISLARLVDAPLLLVFCGDLRRARLVCELRGHAYAQNTRDSFLNAAVDATLAMQAMILAAEAAGLGTRGSVYQGDVLPEEVNHSIGCTIVKYVKHTAPEALRTLVESLDIERPERPEGDDGNRGRPRFEQSSEGFGQRGFGQRIAEQLRVR